MSSGTKQTTQASTSEPWKEAQPLLKTGIKDATGIYSSGTAFQPDTTSQVVPFADQTTAGMTDIQNRAATAMSGPNAFGDAFNFGGDLLKSGGLSGDMAGIMDLWKKTAGGDELNMVSPAFQDVMNRSLDDARTGVDLTMSGAGRYSSPEHTKILADTLGGLSSKMRVDEYGRQLGRMDSARSSVANLGQTGIQNEFGAAEMLPGAWGNMQLPAQDMMKLGGMYEDLMGRTMEDRSRIFNETRDAPKNALEWLMAIGSGAGSLGGSTSGVTKSPAPNPFLSAIAGVAGLNNLFGNPLKTVGQGLFR